MISITPSALSYIRQRDQALHLAMPPMIYGEFNVQEPPDVKFGLPAKMAAYDPQNIEGITVYLPVDFPVIPLTINVTSFFGFKKLVVEGWQLV